MIFPLTYFICMLLSGAEIGRFVTMLRNPSSILKSCAAFALLQVYTYVHCHPFSEVGFLISTFRSEI